MATPTNRYRHRTTEVEAVQWTGDNADQMRAFCSPFDFQTIDPEDRVEDPDKTAAMRESVHGTWQGLAHGDWAVKIDGRFVVGPAEDFAERYEPAAPGTSASDADDLAALRARVAELEQQAAGVRVNTLRETAEVRRSYRLEHRRPGDTTWQRNTPGVGANWSWQSREKADQKLAEARDRWPDVEHRLIETTTTITEQPAAPAAPEAAAPC